MKGRARRYANRKTFRYDDENGTCDDDEEEENEDKESETIGSEDDDENVIESIKNSHTKAPGSVSLSHLFSRITKRKVQQREEEEEEEEDDNSMDEDSPQYKGVCQPISKSKRIKTAPSKTRPQHIGVGINNAVVDMPEVDDYARAHPLREDGRMSDEDIRGSKEYREAFEEARKRLYENPYFKFIVQVSGFVNEDVTRFVSYESKLHQIAYEAAIRSRQKVQESKRLNELSSAHDELSRIEPEFEEVKRMRKEFHAMEEVASKIENLMKQNGMMEAHIEKNEEMIQKCKSAYILLNYVRNSGDYIPTETSMLISNREERFMGDEDEDVLNIPLSEVYGKHHQEAAEYDDVSKQIDYAMDILISNNKGMPAKRWISPRVIRVLESEGADYMWKLPIAATLVLEFIGVVLAPKYEINPFSDVASELGIDPSTMRNLGGGQGQGPPRIIPEEDNDEEPDYQNIYPVEKVIRAIRLGLKKAWNSRKHSVVIPSSSSNNNNNNEKNKSRRRKRPSLYNRNFLSEEEDEEEADKSRGRTNFNDISVINDIDYGNIKRHGGPEFLMQSIIDYAIQSPAEETIGILHSSSSGNNESNNEGKDQSIDEEDEIKPNDNNDSGWAVDLDRDRLLDAIYASIINMIKSVISICKNNLTYYESVLTHSNQKIVSIADENKDVLGVRDLFTQMKYNMRIIRRTETNKKIKKNDEIKEDLMFEARLMEFLRKWLNDSKILKKRIEDEYNEKQEKMQALVKKLTMPEKVERPKLEYEPSMKWIFEPMNSGFFELDSIVISGIESAFLLIKNRFETFSSMENSDPFQCSDESATLFAQVVAGEMIESGVLSPKKWLPGNTLRNVKARTGRALNVLKNMVYDKTNNIVRRRTKMDSMQIYTDHPASYYFN